MSYKSLKTLMKNTFDSSVNPDFIKNYFESVPFFNAETHDIKGTHFIESIQFDCNSKRVFFIKEVVNSGVCRVSEHKTLLKAQNALNEISEA